MKFNRASLSAVIAAVVNRHLAPAFPFPYPHTSTERSLIERDMLTAIIARENREGYSDALKRQFVRLAATRQDVAFSTGLHTRAGLMSLFRPSVRVTTRP